jgi:hypothetical protein
MVQARLLGATSRVEAPLSSDDSSDDRFDALYPGAPILGQAERGGTMRHPRRARLMSVAVCLATVAVMEATT